MLSECKYFFPDNRNVLICNYCKLPQANQLVNCSIDKMLRNVGKQTNEGEYIEWIVLFRQATFGFGKESQFPIN